MMTYHNVRTLFPMLYAILNDKIFIYLTCIYIWIKRMVDHIKFYITNAFGRITQNILLHSHSMRWHSLTFQTQRKSDVKSVWFDYRITKDILSIMARVVSCISIICSMLCFIFLYLAFVTIRYLLCFQKSLSTREILFH